MRATAPRRGGVEIGTGGLRPQTLTALLRAVSSVRRIGRVAAPAPARSGVLAPPVPQSQAHSRKGSSALLAQSLPRLPPCLARLARSPPPFSLRTRKGDSVLTQSTAKSKWRWSTSCCTRPTTKASVVSSSDAALGSASSSDARALRVHGG